MNSKSEDCCINQNLKSGKKKYIGGEEEWVSSELQKALQALEAFCSDIQVW